MTINERKTNIGCNCVWIWNFLSLSHHFFSLVERKYFSEFYGSLFFFSSPFSLLREGKKKKTTSFKHFIFFFHLFSPPMGYFSRMGAQEMMYPYGLSAHVVHTRNLSFFFSSWLLLLFKTIHTMISIWVLFQYW